MIDALTAEYNAKVKELANADKANADALAALDAELEAKIAELNNAITANAAKATALEATLASEIASVKADYATKIDALSLLITSLKNTDTDNVKRIAQLEAEMNALLSQHVHSFGSLINYSGNANVPCENRLFYRVCSECKVIEWKQGTSEDHLYKANYSTDDEYHWYDCVYCGAITGKGEHIENDLGHCEYCDMDSVIYSAGSSSANVTGYRAFAKNVIIADTYNGVPVTAIAGNAFRNSDIVSVVIPDNVKTVGTYAFAYCYELQRVVVGKGVTSISNHAFYCSDTLSDITIGENVTSIGNYAFYNCSNLKSITIPKKVTSIGSSAFQYCSALDSITFPDSVTTIGNYAFEYCV